MRALATLTLVFTLIAGMAWADVIGTRTGTTPIVVGDNEACATLTPIQTVPFVTVRDNQRIVITFSAEGSVKSPNTFTWLNIDLLVDGVEVSPTQTTDNAFVTSRGDNLLAGWVSASTSGVALVPDAGLHTALVRASLIGCSDTAPRDDQWRIDDFATILFSN